MQQTDHFIKGSWNVECDRCGFKYKAHQLQKEWTGLMTCKGGGTNGCWEPRQPQDFVRGVEDNQSPPWVRPSSPDVFTFGEWLADVDGSRVYDVDGVAIRVTEPKVTRDDL